MVYLLHFERKLKHAQHYLGYSENHKSLNKRIECHMKGNGSKLVAAFVRAKINFVIVRVWGRGDRNFERKLKNQKNAPRLCPICKKGIAFQEWLR